MSKLPMVIGFRIESTNWSTCRDALEEVLLVMKQMKTPAGVLHDKYWRLTVTEKYERRFKGQANRFSRASTLANAAAGEEVLFHHLWGKAHDNPDYVKKAWSYLQCMLEKPCPRCAELERSIQERIADIDKRLRHLEQDIARVTPAKPQELLRQIIEGRGKRKEQEAK